MSCPNLMLEPCAGETFRLRVTYANAGTPIDLTGWTVTWTVDATTYTTAPNVVVTPLLGQIDLLLTTTQVAAITDAEYSLVGTDPGLPAGEGDYKILEGRIRVDG